MLFIHPARKTRKQQIKRIKRLKVGDKVITAGGIFGEVTELIAGSNYVVVATGDGQNRTSFILDAQAILEVVESELIADILIQKLDPVAKGEATTFNTTSFQDVMLNDNQNARQQVVVNSAADIDISRYSLTTEQNNLLPGEVLEVKLQDFNQTSNQPASNQSATSQSANRATNRVAPNQTTNSQSANNSQSVNFQPASYGFFPTAKVDSIDTEESDKPTDIEDFYK
ncbi:MAG: preprotein translocase subunit YajC [Firmicutes bacterium]|nr:preprotein translocase subunit YajC [Bacillota bacterium]